MRIVRILYVSSILSGTLAGLLGSNNEATEWFKTKLASEPQQKHGETPASRSYFYVGGRYIDSPYGKVMDGQIYVEKLEPQVGSKQKYPLVFMAGASQTGTNWLNTPDGRTGWASYFLSLGYTIYLTDQPQRGRSPWIPSDGTMTINNVTFVQTFFTSSEKFDAWPQAHLHTQWPGSGEPGDAVFDAFFAGEIQQQENTTTSATKNINAVIALIDQIGDVVLISHSQAGPYGWGIGDQRPERVKGIIALEPQGPPFEEQIIRTGPARPYGITTLPLTYHLPVKNVTSDLPTIRINSTRGDRSDCIIQRDPPRKLINLGRIPVLLYVAEASYHAFYDHCTLAFMEQAGVQVDYLDLAEVGIRGNGHFSFMEKNNLQIAPLLHAWIQETV